MIDYNHFKPHEALRGNTPAEIAGVAEQVPWDDRWEDVARTGGEAAEPRVKEVVTTPNRPGPKPPASVVDAAADYLERKKYEEAKNRQSAKTRPP